MGSKCFIWGHPVQETSAEPCLFVGTASSVPTSHGYPDSECNSPQPTWDIPLPPLAPNALRPDVLFHSSRDKFCRASSLRDSAKGIMHVRGLLR